jgi:asparagine synthetase B (glutamine-hydrolysing)
MPSLRIINDALTFARWQSRAALLGPLKRTRLYAGYRRRKDGRVPNADDADVLTPLDRDEPSAPSPTPADFDLSGVDGGRIFFKALLQCFRTNIALLVRLEDRNATAHGIDLCMPFMDAQLVQAALAFPFHLYMAGGRNKAILRDAAQDLLAPEVSAFRRKLATPGSDGYLAFDVLRPELLDLVSSASFYESGLWSRRCAELYKADLAHKDRGNLWFRVYMVQKWYERVVKAPVQ